jgi:hypothetical protein
MNFFLMFFGLLIGFIGIILLTSYISMKYLEWVSWRNRQEQHESELGR